MFDLQIIGGRLNSEIDKLPSPYRESIRPYFREQLFGKHHQLFAMHNSGAYTRMTEPIRDPETFRKFCGMLHEGVFAWNDAGERNPYFHNPMNRLFYYLIATFTMFVLDEPGTRLGCHSPVVFRLSSGGGIITA